jgi:uncharacterized protein YjbJ (UPF0337 family)
VAQVSAARDTTHKEIAMGENRHKGEELKGRAKEAGGSLTGNRDLQREGQNDQDRAKVKGKVDKAADKVKGVFDRD